MMILDIIVCLFYVVLMRIMCVYLGPVHLHFRAGSLALFLMFISDFWSTYFSRFTSYYIRTFLACNLHV